MLVFRDPSSWFMRIKGLTPPPQVSHPLPLEIRAIFWQGLKLRDNYWLTRWWFQRFFIFIPIWGRFPFWLIFFKGVDWNHQLVNDSLYYKALLLFLTLLGPFFLSKSFYIPFGDQPEITVNRQHEPSTMQVIQEVTKLDPWSLDVT